MKFLVAFLMLGLWCESAPAQCAPGAWSVEEMETAGISAKVSFFEDTTGRLPLDVVLLRTFGAMPDKNWMEKTNASARSRIWMRFAVNNFLGADTLRLVFFPGTHGLTTLFEQNGADVTPLAQGGFFARQPALDWQANLHGLPLEVLPGRCPTYLVSVKNFFKMYDQLRAKTFRPEAYRSYCQAYHERQLPVLLFLGFVIGGLAILLVFGLMQFLLTRGPAYLWYALYALANGLNFVRVLEMFSDVRWVSDLVPEFEIYLLLTPAALTFCYLQFIGHFLDFHQRDSAVSRWFGRVVAFFGLIFLLTVAGGVLLFTQPELADKIAFWYHIVHFLVFFLAFLVLFMVLKARGVLPRFIAVGTFLLLAGGVVSTLLDRAFEQPPLHAMGLSNSPVFWLGIFILLENLCFALGLGYKTKLLEIEKRLAVIAQERDRQRIARDLHDDLGSSIGAIGLLSDIALSKTGSAGMSAEVGKIAESARRLSTQVHEIIWAANAQNDTLEKLAGYIHQYAVGLFEGSGIELSAQLPAELPARTISGEHRRAIFLAFKEALHNTLKHARATRVDLEFDFAEKHFALRIRDNGRGFDAAATGDSGNGLTNMRKRMEDIGGQFRLESGSAGTLVTLHLPL